MKNIDSLFNPGRRYGITEKKKAELDALSNQVIDAQYTVEQLQAVVTSLTDKSLKFDGFLSVADASKAKALSNRNLLDQVVDNVLSLMSNSGIAFNEMALADLKTKEVAIGIKTMVDKLIYSAEVINKLASFVIRKKALNPLISDDLVARIGAAGNDANNAVALALIALQSTFAAQASNLESEAATALEYVQSMKLYEILSGKTPSGDDSEKAESCLMKLIYDAYGFAEIDYEQAYQASKTTALQLNKANADLNKAQVKLRSLQAGLAAGNAAALAS